MTSHWHSRDQKHSKRHQPHHPQGSQQTDTDHFIEIGSKDIECFMASDGAIKNFSIAVAAAVVAGIILWWILGSDSPSPPKPGPTGSTSSSPTPPTPGYTSLWRNRSVNLSTTGLSGVIFQQNGPVTTPFGDGGASDVVYSGSWQIQNGSMSEWLSSSAPGPGSCASQSGKNAAENTAAVTGDQYCFVNDEAPDGPIIVTMKVTGFSQTPNDIIVSTSGWAPKS
jgi:hypothetical protein